MDQAELLNPVQQIPLSVDRTGSLLARCHAMSTGLSTDPAVLMVGSMTLALLTTQAASYSADIQHPADDLLVGAGATSGNSAGDVADVGAVQVQADTLGQVLNIVFGQTCIRTGRTYLSAGVALLDAADEGIIGASPNVRMGSDHLLSLHRGLPDELGEHTAVGSLTMTVINDCSRCDQGLPSQIVQDRAFGSLIPVTSFRELLDRALQLTHRPDLCL